MYAGQGQQLTGSDSYLVDVQNARVGIEIR